MITAQDILETLPPDQEVWELIMKKQYVPDIVNEICTAHRLFGSYYDCFSYMFLHDNPEQTAEMLHQFCRMFIDYKEETMHRQTSSIPTGILERGYGDCKHYALFCGGVLGSLNRLYNAGIDWDFRFVGYDDAVEPYHVFVSINYQGDELWLDPTPGAGGTISVMQKKKP